MQKIESIRRTGSKLAVKIFKSWMFVLSIYSTFFLKHEVSFHDISFFDRDIDLLKFIQNLSLVIGRAIRHRDDYACILLLDQRYTQEKVVRKLPQWIRTQLQHHARFGPGLGAISKVFIFFVVFLLF